MPEADPLSMLQRSLDRERKARREAEAIAERATRALYEALDDVNRQVQQRTEELERAVKQGDDARRATLHMLRDTERVQKQLELSNRELKLQRRELERAEARFRATVESAPTAMVMVDPEGEIVLVNAETEKLFGYAREELLGRPVEILVPEKFREGHPDLRAGFFAFPESRRMGAGRDLYGLHKDGSEFPVEIGLNPVETEDGLFVLSAVADISERKWTERELIRYADELRRMNRELDSFAYVASHDLQEPVRNLVSYGTLLKEDLGDDLPPDAAEDLHFITDASKRMQRLVQDLLAFSRAGRSELKRNRLGLDHCVDEALGILRQRVEETGATIKRDPLPEIDGDETMLTQVFQNLLGNAMKFAGDRPPVIHITAAQADGQWTCGVKDNGIGIQPEFVDQVFAPFRRVHGMAEYEGSGIGLAICRKVVERHGGKIWVESNPGEGSHFQFTLPNALIPSSE